MNIKSSTARTNRVVLILHWVLDAFLILGYIVEWLKGGRSAQFVVVFLIIVVIPMVAATIVYIKDNDTRVMRIITLLGYFLLYSIVIFSSTRTLVYVYMFPIISMYLLYFNLRLIVLSCSFLLVSNVGRIIWLVTAMGMNDASITTDYTIQFASVFLYGFSLIVSTRLSNRFNYEKISSIEDQNKQQEEILKDVLHIAAILDNNSNKVFSIVEELSQTTNNVTNAVSEIAAGADETTNSIQSQSELTHNIQSIIQNTSKLAEDMRSITESTAVTVNQGLGIIRNLSQEASKVEADSEETYTTMLELKERSNEIQSMSNLISEISEQTNLLSLNAAIESARAGEVGRGFAVVAEEIGKLADESKNSAGKIAQIVSGLEKNADRSLAAVKNLKEINTAQNDYIHDTENVFNDITTKMEDVNSIVILVETRINDILQSNNKIVENINSISGVAEQTSATTQEASSMTEQNIERSQKARDLVQELIDTSKQMKKYMKEDQ